MPEYITERDLESAHARLEEALSTKFLRSFVGSERLRRLETVLGRDVTRADLLQLVVRSEGMQLIANPQRKIGQSKTSIRRKLLEGLSEERVRSLHLALEPTKEVPKQVGKVVSRLAEYKWHRGKSGARLFTDALGLPMSFAGLRETEKRGNTFEIPPYAKVPPLKAFQRGVLRAAQECLQERGRGMISSFTGTGKTRMGMEFAIDLLMKCEGEGVVWIAQKRELLDQACDAIEQLWAWCTQSLGESLTVFRYMEGSDFDAEELPQTPFFVVATSQQVQARIGKHAAFIEEAFSRSSLLVIDEAHYSLAPGHQLIINAFEKARADQPTRVLGLTATPGRSNLTDADESLRLAELFDRQLIVPDVATDGSALEWFQEQGYLSRLRHEKVEAKSQVAQTAAKRHIDLVEETDGVLDFKPEVLRLIGEDSARNRHIIQVVTRLHSEKRHMLVFCCDVEQAEILSGAMILQGIPCAVIHHKKDRRDRRNIIRKFRSGEIRILLNVEVLTTGFDAPKVDTIVMCRPTLSRILYEQMVGRGLRGPGMGGTESCTVVDFTDNFTMYDEPQAWEHFWKDWNSRSMFQDAAGEGAENNWSVRRAVPEDAAADDVD